MSADFTRRSLATGIGAAGLGLGGLALLAPHALADTSFTSFAFPATGTSTPRTMPDRLAEIKSVKDFGATGNGTTDDTAAIQAAVNWTSGANRGTIYFPLGRYLVSSPITLNYDGDLSICFRGEASGSYILANFNGYVFDRSLATPNNTSGGRVFEKLAIINSGNAGGCIRIGSTIGGAIRDCILSGFICVTTEDSVGASSQSIYINNCNFTCRGGTSPNGEGRHGLIIGGGGVVTGCDFNANADVAIRAYGSNLFIGGNRVERNNTAYLLGLDSGGNNVGLSGFAILGGTTEGNWTSIDFSGSCSGFMIGSVALLGHDASNAGAVSGIQGTQYGVRIRADMAKNGMISGVGVSSVAEVASFAIEGATSRANLLISNLIALQTAGTGVGWILPSNAYTAQFQNCNTQAVWAFSQLPSGADVLEGDEFDISDSPTATWGASVTTGGGGNHVRVRYNGSNWTVMGG